MHQDDCYERIRQNITARDELIWFMEKVECSIMCKFTLERVITGRDLDKQS